jgi:hypothetical protein
MADYVTNGEISQAIYLADLKADVDLGGPMFSYMWGMFYLPNAQELPIRLPPPFQGSP